MDPESIAYLQRLFSVVELPILILVILWLCVTWNGQLKRSRKQHELSAEQHVLFVSNVQQSKEHMQRADEVNNRTIAMLERWEESINRLADIMDKLDSKLER